MMQISLMEYEKNINNKNSSIIVLVEINKNIKTRLYKKNRRLNVYILIVFDFVLPKLLATHSSLAICYINKVLLYQLFFFFSAYLAYLFIVQIILFYKKHAILA